MALANVHCIVGLHELGYHVHYVEHQDRPDDCYDPHTRQMTSDPAVATAFLDALLPQYGLGPADYSFIDLRNECHGSGWDRLNETLRRADFVMDLGNASWFDELELCPRRAFADVDPMFTQVALLNANGDKTSAVGHYDMFFTEGVRIGRPDCTIPTAGRQWIPARTAIATSLWRADARGGDGPLTTLMNWSSGSEITFEGRSYGYKNREFERVVDLPSRVDKPCVIALGGRNAPRDRLRGLGWQIADPLAVTGSIPAYQEFIAGSFADLGIAKHAYVESQSGWFSDRSTCYMAAGRPVLHQNTGLADCLPVGEGVLLFNDADEAVEALREVELDYERHSRAARALAEEHFEASKVFRGMIEAAGWS